MVVKISSPARLIAALNYNENKVKQAKAECLHASGYLRDAKEMNFYQKLEGFENRNRLNTRAKTKTLHISLNFDPYEKLSNKRLISIATDYMEKIGFANQPWMMYKHLDAGHPHIHIVATTIQADGSRINTFNIGRNQSEKARKEIELQYGLVQAEKQKRVWRQAIAPIHLEKIGYGKIETKKSITHVVNEVMKSYRFSSLPEFNAILKTYNVTADRGLENSRIHKHKGLVFRILDSEGKKIGVPIKASSINSSPTLKKLEELFEKNKLIKQQYKESLKTDIDKVLENHPKNLNQLITQLERKNILTVLRKNSEGRIYGITFVDRNTRTAFNGSDLGKAYSIAHLEEKFNNNSQIPEPPTLEIPSQEPPLNPETLDLLLHPKQEFNQNTNYQFKKKRKRKTISHH